MERMEEGKESSVIIVHAMPANPIPIPIPERTTFWFCLWRSLIPLTALGAFIISMILFNTYANDCRHLLPIVLLFLFVSAIALLIFFIAHRTTGECRASMQRLPKECTIFIVQVATLACFLALITLARCW